MSENEGCSVTSSCGVVLHAKKKECEGQVLVSLSVSFYIIMVAWWLVTKRETLP